MIDANDLFAAGFDLLPDPQQTEGARKNHVYMDEGLIVDFFGLIMTVKNAKTYDVLHHNFIPGKEKFHEILAECRAKLLSIES